MKILGLSAFYHDSAAALIDDGEIVAAAQEERFTRRKHDPSFPINALNYCLDEAGCAAGALDHVVFYDKPFLTFERLLETHLALVPGGLRSFCKAMPVWLKDKLFQKQGLIKQMRALDPDVAWRDRLLFTEHHVSHAASAFYPSPFDRALVLCMDGVGEWATTSVALGQGRDLEILRELHFPHSLGLLYSAFTYHAGFQVNSGEYKLMGLAPYGEPVYASKILGNLMDLKDDGSFRLNQDYFDYAVGLKMTNRKFDRLFGWEPRHDDQLLEQKHMDLAASIQAVTNEVMLRLTRSLAKETGERNLCLAGGVALNCVANGEILRDGSFENIWIQPAAGDAGGAVGAALAAYHGFAGQSRTDGQQSKAGGDGMRGAYLGPAYNQAEIERRLTTAGAHFTVLPEPALIDHAATAMTDGLSMGWFQGRMEFGPRALGNRSIIGDPRNPAMQKTLNLRIKYRESFRPFAPSIRREDVSDWFELDRDSPYMLLVAGVRPEHRRDMTADEQALFGIDKLNIARSSVPAITHVDYSARVQTVDAETNPRYHALLTEFQGRTGCPILVNTSFNVRGEPIVCTPEDAFRCFMGTELDVLAIGDCWLVKSDQNPDLKGDSSTAFAPD